MLQPINSLEFWSNRLKEAKRTRQKHFSVFVGGLPDTEHKKIIEKFIKNGDSVIDVGCGYGRCSDWFKNYVGVDFSPDFIEEARKLYPTKKFEIQDFLKLNYSDKSFEWALSVGCKNMCIENINLEYWEKVVKEMKRVAKRVLILEMIDVLNYEVF